MIDSQLRTSGVVGDDVIRRMGEVAREDFVPASVKGVAYVDRAIPLGDGKFLAAPLVHGKMLQEAAPKPHESAIVVDGGSGYLAELLRPLVASLKVLTPQEALEAGRGKKADLLIIDGAAEHIPDALAKRLADNGRIVTGIVRDGVTHLAQGRKLAGTIALQPIAEIGIPRLPQFDEPKGWRF
ncbi:protein-L-isoaspartate O-methyltransferase [Alteraurantiacibacter aestuarii]|uniref:Protein-L-isoaspartate O-methyltransferase n=2 Tax=Alteraurantiacibacter aestuarii TaxID=650004 RepID=A0A844ZMN8_9SPHN|nr:protein-L-isoaspartate O-methyltransferase [Alteraurantiacibacter aestuarii]